MGRSVLRAAGTVLAVLLVAGCARTGAPPPTAVAGTGDAGSGGAMLARVEPATGAGDDASGPEGPAGPTTTAAAPVPVAPTTSVAPATTAAAPVGSTDDRPTSTGAVVPFPTSTGAVVPFPTSTGAVVPFPTTATPAGDDEAVVEFAARVDALRASHGAGRLVPDADLAASASAQVAAMMAAGDLFHQELQDELDRGWSVVGENVGFGPGVTAIHDALVGSPGHFANLVNARYTHVGIAVRTDGNGRLWVAQVFGG